MQNMSMLHSHKKIHRLPMMSFLVSFAVFISVFNKTVYSTVSIACVYASVLFLVLFIPRFSINKWDVLILCLFYVTPFLWVVVSAVHCFVMGSGFIAFVPTTIGRMANCCVYLCMYLVVRASCQRGLVSTELLLRAYSYGCIVLLAFGWWQLAHYILGVPFLNIETRNFIHSMDGNIGLGFRVTSIAEEPAYLIPYLIDLFIVVFYKAVPSLSARPQVRGTLLAGVMGLLLFTLSLSAYCNFAFVVLWVFVFMRRTKRKFLFGFLLSLLAVLMVALAGDMILAVLQRLNFQDLMASNRLQEGYLPILHMLNDASPFTILLGYGPKGFDYIRQFVFYKTGWLTGQPIATTSHVIFIDFFVEYGLLGLGLLVGLFGLLWYMATSVYRYGGGRIAQLLVANLLVCCLYTADYASPRFTILVAIIVCLYIENKRRLFHENFRHNPNLQT